MRDMRGKGFGETGGNKVQQGQNERLMGIKVSFVAVPDSVFANICIVICKELRLVIFEEQ